MRTKLDLPVSTGRRITDKLAMSGISMPGMPLTLLNEECLEEGNWRLPSGKALAEFALQAGFLAPLLFDGRRAAAGEHRDQALGREKAASSRAKSCGKGSSH